MLPQLLLMFIKNFYFHKEKIFENKCCKRITFSCITINSCGSWLTLLPMWHLHKLMNNLATKEVHSISIWQSSMCKIYWAKKETLGNLSTCSFHHVTALKAFTLKTTMQQNIKNLDMNKTPLAFGAKIRTFKKVAYNKICKLWCIDVSNRVQKLHNFNQ